MEKSLYGSGGSNKSTTNGLGDGHASKAAGTEHELTKTIAGATEQVLNTMDDITKNLKEKSKESTENIEKYVHENPLKAVGIALALGALTAILFKK